jgi:hypothetical protein
MKLEFSKVSIYQIAIFLILSQGYTTPDEKHSYNFITSL